MKKAFILVFSLALDPSFATMRRPEFSIVQSRVKLHCEISAAGNLVQGEEHLRKVILGWHPIPGAEAYEICHQCLGKINEYTGEELSTPTDHELIPFSVDFTCGGNPCLVLPGAPMG